MKLPENDLSPEVAAAWDSIATLGILPMNEPYNSQTFLALAGRRRGRGSAGNDPRLYRRRRIVDETTARSEIQVPGVGSRDGVDYQLEERTASSGSTPRAASTWTRPQRHAVHWLRRLLHHHSGGWLCPLVPGRRCRRQDHDRAGAGEFRLLGV